MPVAGTDESTQSQTAPQGERSRLLVVSDALLLSKVCFLKVVARATERKLKQGAQELLVKEKL